jgi:hypothetical protein
MTDAQLLILFAAALVIVLILTRLRHGRVSRRQRVLKVFLRYPETRWYVTDLCRVARLPGGSIYPELARLEQERWLLSDWEPEPSTPVGPRRQYWLNPWKEPSSRERSCDSRMDGRR